MENSALQIYKAIGTVQSIIANATTLDEARRRGNVFTHRNAVPDVGIIV